MIRTILIIIFLIPSSHAYLQKKGEAGRGLLWLPPNISYNLNTSGCQENIKSELLQITEYSAKQWSDNTRLNLKVDTTTASPRSLVNDIYCSSDPTYSGSSAVVGVTKVVYNESTGQIVQADILINNKSSLSTDSGDSNFVGNVLTHEFGHSIGYDHSEAFRSSMFYSLFLGQQNLSNDDIAGAYALYPTGSTKGTIKGRVIGGTVDNPIGIFGAYVSAYSTQTGELMGSSVSLDNGPFQIAGLPIGDQYYLYVTPLKLVSTISKYYSSVRTTFCGANSARVPYRGTFFTTCQTEPGYPQGIDLSTNQVDVGSISAYCELREIKLEREREFVEEEQRITPFPYLELNGYLSNFDFGSSFVSYFSPNELKANAEATATILQEFEVDLAGTEVPEGENFLDIKLTSQDFYSQVQLTMEVIKNYKGIVENQEPYIFTSVDDDGYIKTNSDNQPELNLIGRVPLDPGYAPENDFKIKITATKVDFDDYPDFSENDFFPDNKNFADDIGFYLGIISISQFVDGHYKTIKQKDYGLIRDNLSCPGASNALPISAVVESSPSQDKEDGFFSCNSVEPNGGGGSGPLTFTLGFLLSVLVSRRTHVNLNGR